MCFASVSLHCRVPTAVMSQASAITSMSVINLPTLGIAASVAMSMIVPSSSALSPALGL